MDKYLTKVTNIQQQSFEFFQSYKKMPFFLKPQFCNNETAQQLPKIRLLRKAICLFNLSLHSKHTFHPNFTHLLYQQNHNNSTIQQEHQKFAKLISTLSIKELKNVLLKLLKQRSSTQCCCLFQLESKNVQKGTKIVWSEVFASGIRDNNQFQSDYECLGCIRIFYQSIPINFNPNPKLQKRKIFVYKNSNFIQKQLEVTEGLSALLNSGGGFIFVIGNQKIGDFKKGEGNVKGFQITDSERHLFKKFFDCCRRYIQPELKKDEMEVHFVPSFQKVNAEFDDRWIIRISVFPKRPQILYYVGYKIMSNDINKQPAFFTLDIENRIQLLNFKEVYKGIHLKHKLQSKKEISLTRKNHKNLKCYNPLIKSTSAQEIDQPLNIIDVHQKISHKFKHTMIVVTAKDSKDTLERAQEFKRELVQSKIIFGCEKLNIPNTKVVVWIFKYDALSVVVESVFKMFNRNGEFIAGRVKRMIKIVQDDFFYNKRDQAMQKGLKEIRKQFRLPEQLQMQMFNTDDERLNRNSHKPVFLRFKNSRDAILCFGLLYATIRRLQFTQQKPY